MSDYAGRYYDILDATSLRSARRVVPRVMDLVRPARVVDVGCGRGGWLRVFLEHRVAEVLGVDGDWVDPAGLHIPGESFQHWDLRQPLEITGTFDLAVSLEVAEHLPAASADGFVDALTSLAPVVLFSAAIPHQGGVGHVNEQWPEYWAERFARRGFAAVDVLRREIWDDPDVAWWYAQNLLLFSREAEAAAPVPRLVHPRHYLIKVEELRNRSEPERMSLRTLLAQAPQVLRHTFRRRLRRGG
jgi:SAM-dependent methyltransferase